MRSVGSSDPLHVWFYGGVFGVSGSNNPNSGLTKFNRYVGENNARGVTRLVTIYILYMLPLCGEIKIIISLVFSFSFS